MKNSMRRQVVTTTTTSRRATPDVNDKAVKVLATSIYRQLQDEGCAPRDIISISSQLIDLVTIAIQKDDDGAAS